ncbi:hypothetical protein ACL1CN_10505 [Corynebacterium striatum]|nr:hypothetical protein [Corynebacterium striatum]HCG2985052.1 hypothetical protein [Corynebacterium striatum]HCG3001079.1 hypothetical protein [Corynebacterium striatum]HCG3016726.1 hypothetical protein [Corynebacterium striatum]HCG3143391.1 hypothetical protein [Corynebacterium striatum]
MTQLQLTELIQSPYMKENHILGDWAHHADKAVKQLAASGKPFTTDDIRQHIPDGLTPKHNNAWGALLNAWARRGTIRPIGYTTGKRTQRHGGIQRIWQGH